MNDPHRIHAGFLPMMRRCALALLLLGAAAIASGRASATELAFDLRIVGGRVPESMRFVRVTQGDLVKLRWSTDRATLLHLHGYDLERRVEPGQIVEMVFEARATGRFPIHAHATGPQPGGLPREGPALVYVEVYPR
jgi:hypothetical protein